MVEKLEFFSRIKSLSREIEIVMKVDSPIRHCLHSIIRLDHLITTEYHSNHTVSLVIVLKKINSQEGFSKTYQIDGALRLVSI